jgi:PAS domain S-box-containing protein
MWTYTEVSLRRAREAEIHDLAVRNAQLAASELDRIFDGVRTFLIALAESPELRRLDSTSCVPYLTALNDKLPHLASILLIDLEGRVQCRRSPAPADLRFDDRSYFKQAVATGTFAVGEYSIAKIRQTPVLPVAAPFRDESGKIVGVISVALDLKWLRQEVKRRVLPEGGSLTIADRNGTILAREPHAEQFVGTRIPDVFIKLVHADRAGSTELLSRDGTKRVLGYVPASLSSNGIYVSSGIATKVAFSTIDAAAKRGFVLIAAAFVLALSLASLSGRVFVTKPFGKMLSAVRAWRQGDYDARIALSEKDGELGILAAAINDLMDDIAIRQAALQESEERARLALDAGQMGTWWFDPVRKVTSWSPQAAALLGLPAGQVSSDLAHWGELMHPDDRPRARDAFERALREGDYEAEFRIRHADGQDRWINARGRVVYDLSRRPTNLIGVLYDITGPKRAEEQQRLLLDELNHRVKNTLATVQSIASQTLRTSKPDEFKPMFESRLLALSKTHDLLVQNAWREADLGALIEQEVAPYRREGDDRIVVSGPQVSLPARAVINLGLVVHELVTNAVKYGALSVPAGRLEITWTTSSGDWSGGDLDLVWREAGGPPVTPPKRRGLGSRLIHRSTEGELNGTAVLDYQPTGLVARLRFPIQRAAPEAADPVQPLPSFAAAE